MEGYVVVRFELVLLFRFISFYAKPMHLAHAELPILISFFGDIDIDVWWGVLFRSNSSIVA